MPFPYSWGADFDSCCYGQKWLFPSPRTCCCLKVWETKSILYPMDRGWTAFKHSLHSSFGQEATESNNTLTVIVMRTETMPTTPAQSVTYRKCSRNIYGRNEGRKEAWREEMSGGWDKRWLRPPDPWTMWPWPQFLSAQNAATLELTLSHKKNNRCDK